MSPLEASWAKKMKKKVNNFDIFLLFFAAIVVVVTSWQLSRAVHLLDRIHCRLVSDRRMEKMQSNH